VISTNHKRIEESVKRNVEKVQKKQKEHYNKKHGAGSCYSVGSLVYKKDFLHKRDVVESLIASGWIHTRLQQTLEKASLSCKLSAVEGGKVSY